MLKELESENKINSLRKNVILLGNSGFAIYQKPFVLSILGKMSGDKLYVNGNLIHILEEDHPNFDIVSMILDRLELADKPTVVDLREIYSNLAI